MPIGRKLEPVPYSVFMPWEMTWQGRFLKEQLRARKEYEMGIIRKGGITPSLPPVNLVPPSKRPTSSPTHGDRWSSERGYMLPQEDVNAFAQRVHDLAVETFGKDFDGDCPVEVEVVDRTRRRSNVFVAPQYGHKAGDEEEYEDCLYNLRIAVEAMDTCEKIKRMKEKKP